MFKNAIAYLVTDGYRIDPEILARVPAMPCAPNQGRTAGFSKPCLHATDEFVHRIGSFSLICLETEDRLLPGSVVAEEVAERAAALESQQGYKPGRKQMREIKERVTEELLPRAFTQKRRTLAVFAGKFFIVDTSSPARADMVIETLRRALDELPLSMISTQHGITGEMIKWLLGDAPFSITVDNYVELERAEPGKPAISYKNTDLDENDMQRRIGAGYIPRKLGITVAERLSFKIDDSLHLKQLVALDLLKVDAEDSKNAEEMFDADMSLMSGELVSVLNALIHSLGGLVQVDEGPFSTSHNPANENDSDDPLYIEAAGIVIKHGKASISLVQRHLRIGYNRAARLIEDMENAKIVSPMDSSGSRRVLAANDERKAA